jgi:hypothetical protein
MKFRIENPLHIYGIGGFLVMAAILFNAGLAIINAHIIPVTTTHVILCEIIILGLACIFLGFRAGSFPNILPPLIFMFFMIVMFLYLSIWQGHFFVKPLRDMLLIAVFFMVGGTMTERSVIKTFGFIATLVLFFLVVENYFTEIYVSIFEPSNYYAATRGVEELSVDDSGLFRNSLGYNGRWSFGFLSDHRLSSIFLEQVSMANFCMVLALFTATFWTNLTRNEKILFFVTTVLILLTNSTRTGTFVCLCIFAGYFIFPRLPRYTHLIYLPLILLIGFAFFYDPRLPPLLTTDDLIGRVGLSMRSLASLDTKMFTGGTMAETVRLWDAGYSYVILSQTIFGAIALWIFISFIVPPLDARNIRYNNSLAICIFFNLLIGTAIFSIKVSAPLWIIAGFLYHEKYKKTEQVEAYVGR